MASARGKQAAPARRRPRAAPGEERRDAQRPRAEGSKVQGTRVKPAPRAAPAPAKNPGKKRKRAHRAASRPTPRDKSPLAVSVPLPAASDELTTLPPAPDHE